MENEAVGRETDEVEGIELIFREAEPYRMPTDALHVIRRPLGRVLANLSCWLSRWQSGGARTGNSTEGGKWTCQATIL